MTLSEVRDALRRERERRVGSRAKLVDLTAKEGTIEPIDESTIYRIETDASYIPGIDTVLRLIEVMPGLTCAEFFSAGLRSDAGAPKDQDGALRAPHGDQIPAASVGQFLAILRDFSVELVNLTMRLQRARQEVDGPTAGADAPLSAGGGSVAGLDGAVSEK